MAIAGYLKQNTAATIVLGPFVDSTDGATAKTSLTVNQAAVRLSKNAGTFAQKNDSTSGTHMENGYYSVPISTTDTNTAGRLTVSAAISTSLPVRQDYVVLRADEFDALFSSTGSALRGILATGTAQAATGTTIQLAASETFGDATLVGATVAAYGSTQGYWQTRAITAYTASTDTATVDAWSVTPTGTITYVVFAGSPASTATPIPANVVQVAGQTASASGAVTFPNATLASTTNITAATGVTLAAVTHTGATIPTVTTTGTATNVTTVNGLAANVITASSIASGALTAAKFASGAFDAVWTVTTRSLTTFGTLVADIWAALTSGLTTTGSIGKFIVDNTGGSGGTDWTTNERQQIRHRLGIDGSAAAPTATPSLASATSLDTVSSYIDTEVAAIKAKTDQLTFTTAGQVDAGVQTIIDAARRTIAVETLITLAAARGHRILIDGTDIVVTDTDGTTELSRQPFTRLSGPANPFSSVG